MDLKQATVEQWLDAQYSVLGSALIAPEVIPRIMEGTSERDYSGECRTVYRAMRKLFIDGVDIDPVSVNDALGGRYTSFLLQLMEITPTASGVDRYIVLCREQAQLNGLRDLARQMAEANSADEMRKLFEQANALMISKPRLKITTMAQALEAFFLDQQQPANYLSWPIRELDRILFVEPGDFVVLGGYPSAGKTAFALQCLWHLAKQVKVGFFSLETQSKKLFARQMSAVAGIPMQDIKQHCISQAGWDRLCSMVNRITKTDIELVNAAGCTLEDIRAVTLMRRYKIIFVDYLQLVEASGYNRAEEVASISRGLHIMAQTLGVTIIALSQLNRSQNDGQKEDLPDLSRLRESGQIEQDADVVLMLSLKNRNKRDGYRVLQVAKNKEGTRPDMVLSFDGEKQTFAKVTEADQYIQAVTDVKNTVKPSRAKRGSSAASSESSQIPKEWVPGQYQLLPDDTPVPYR